MAGKESKYKGLLVNWLQVRERLMVCLVGHLQRSYCTSEQFTGERMEKMPFVRSISYWLKVDYMELRLSCASWSHGWWPRRSL